MQRKLCAYLEDILDAAEAIEVFTAGLTFAEFEADDLIRSAVERKFEIIGEALKQAATSFPGSVASVPDLKEVIGQRHWIAHGYFSLDPIILWRSKIDDLPLLVEEIRRLVSLNCK
jgi:uncharacterized protein with HEPN domain